MIAYFDTFSGASGDMIVGALIDAGLSLDELRRELAKLPLTGYQVRGEKVQRGGLSATKFSVDIERAEEHHHRNLADIVGLIDASALSDRVKDTAKRIFTRLAEAEAAVHGKAVSEVHFHEVGAVDSIIDIVGAAIGVERLGITRVISGPLRFGSGIVKTQHGELPVPAPATVRLAEGVPVRHTGIQCELTTPTGAAVLTALAESFGQPPPMRLKSVGLGAGSAELAERPNVIRVLIGVEDESVADRVVILEANIDDASGEIIGYAMESILAAGALDVFALPIQMKKSRPGTLLSVIARPEDASKMEEIIFRETTTFGIRRREELRTKLDRRFVEVAVHGAKVRVKCGVLGGRVVTVAPEYEDCARLAREKNIPLRDIYAAARDAAGSHGAGSHGA